MEELTEAGRQARNEYHREYRKKKRDEERQRKIRYWNKKGKELEETNKSN